MASTSTSSARGTAISKPVEGDALLALVEDLAAELRAGRRPTATLDSKLEDDLGLDSLARMERRLRLERQFGLTVAEELTLAAETPRDLLSAPSTAASRARAVPAPATPRASDVQIHSVEDQV
jgi:acyl carrier protein